MNTNMSQKDIPQSVRIRTDDGNEYRFDAIEAASELYGVNRSDAVARACDDVARLADALVDILERDDLTRRQQREIADQVDRATSFEVDVENSAEVGRE